MAGLGCTAGPLTPDRVGTVPAPWEAPVDSDLITRAILNLIDWVDAAAASVLGYVGFSAQGAVAIAAVAFLFSWAVSE